jgi:predicted nucleotidyltransferase
MLKIINNLKPFFKDNYKKINVREYSRTNNISPPTASKLLEKYHKQKLLEKEKFKNYIFYSANINSKILIDLSRIYWNNELIRIGLIDYLKKNLFEPVIFLFGSFSKAEINKNSDIDIAIFTISGKIVNISRFEQKLKRKIQVFQFKDIKSVKNKELLSNILEGYLLSGNW